MRPNETGSAAAAEVKQEPSAKQLEVRLRDAWMEGPDAVKRFIQKYGAVVRLDHPIEVCNEQVKDISIVHMLIFPLRMTLNQGEKIPIQHFWTLEELKQNLKDLREYYQKNGRSFADVIDPKNIKFQLQKAVDFLLNYPDGYERLELLLQLNAYDIDSRQDKDGNTAYHLAARRGDEKLCVLLEAAGANMRATNDNDQRACDLGIALLDALSLANPAKRIVKLLKKDDHASRLAYEKQFAHLPDSDTAKQNELRFIAEHGAGGIFIDVADRWVIKTRGEERKKRNSVIKSILDHPAPYSEALLHQLAAKNDWSSVWTIIEIFKADPNVSSVNLSSIYGRIICYAAERASPEILQELIDLGADDRADTERDSPLMHALKAGKSPNIDLLLARGVPFAEPIRKSYGFYIANYDNPVDFDSVYHYHSLTGGYFKKKKGLINKLMPMLRTLLGSKDPLLAAQLKKIKDTFHLSDMTFILMRSEVDYMNPLFRVPMPDLERECQLLPGIIAESEKCMAQEAKKTAQKASDGALEAFMKKAQELINECNEAKKEYYRLTGRGFYIDDVLSSESRKIVELVLRKDGAGPEELLEIDSRKKPVAEASRAKLLEILQKLIPQMREQLEKEREGLKATPEDLRLKLYDAVKSGPEKFKELIKKDGNRIRLDFPLSPAHTSRTDLSFIHLLLFQVPVVSGGRAWTLLELKGTINYLETYYRENGRSFADVIDFENNIKLTLLQAFRLFQTIPAFGETECLLRIELLLMLHAYKGSIDSLQDEDGNTVYHIIAKMGGSRIHSQICHLLEAAGINAYATNKKGERADQVEINLMTTPINALFNPVKRRLENIDKALKEDDYAAYEKENAHLPKKSDEQCLQELRHIAYNHGAGKIFLALGKQWLREVEGDAKEERRLKIKNILDRPDPNAEALLHRIAAKKEKDWPLITTLIKTFKADPNVPTAKAQSSYGRIICYAAEYAPAAVLKELIDLGADDRAKVDRDSALMHALKAGRVDIIDLLLAQGVPFDEKIGVSGLFFSPAFVYDIYDSPLTFDAIYRTFTEGYFSKKLTLIRNLIPVLREIKEFLGVEKDSTLEAVLDGMKTKYQLPEDFVKKTVDHQNPFFRVPMPDLKMLIGSLPSLLSSAKENKAKKAEKDSAVALEAFMKEARELVIRFNAAAKNFVDATGRIFIPDSKLINEIEKNLIKLLLVEDGKGSWLTLEIDARKKPVPEAFRELVLSNLKRLIFFVRDACKEEMKADASPEELRKELCEALARGPDSFKAVIETYGDKVRLDFPLSSDYTFGKASDLSFIHLLLLRQKVIGNAHHWTLEEVQDAVEYLKAYYQRTGRSLSDVIDQKNIRVSLHKLIKIASRSPEKYERIKLFLQTHAYAQGINHPDALGNTAYHCAAIDNDGPLCRLLEAAHINTDARNNNKKRAHKVTTLSNPARERRVGIKKALKEDNVALYERWDSHITRTDEQTIKHLEFLAYKGVGNIFLATAEKWLAAAPEDEKNKRIAVIKRIIDKPVSSDAEVLLHGAAKRGNWAAIYKLIDRFGADPDVCSTNSENAFRRLICVAAYNAGPEEMQKLIDRKADYKLAGLDRDSAMLAAVEAKKEKNIDLLLGLGVPFTIEIPKSHNAYVAVPVVAPGGVDYFVPEVKSTISPLERDQAIHFLRGFFDEKLKLIKDMMKILREIAPRRLKNPELEKICNRVKSEYEISEAMLTSDADINYQNPLFRAPKDWLNSETVRLYQTLEAVKKQEQKDIDAANKKIVEDKARVEKEIAEANAKTKKEIEAEYQKFLGDVEKLRKDFNTTSEKYYALDKVAYVPDEVYRSRITNLTAQLLKERKGDFLELEIDSRKKPMPKDTRRLFLEQLGEIVSRVQSSLQEKMDARAKEESRQAQLAIQRQAEKALKADQRQQAEIAFENLEVALSNLNAAIKKFRKDPALEGIESDKFIVESIIQLDEDVGVAGGPVSYLDMERSRKNWFVISLSPDTQYKSPNDINEFTNLAKRVKIAIENKSTQFLEDKAAKEKAAQAAKRKPITPAQLFDDIDVSDVVDIFAEFTAPAATPVPDPTPTPTPEEPFDHYNPVVNEAPRELSEKTERDVQKFNSCFQGAVELLNQTLLKFNQILPSNELASSLLNFAREIGARIQFTVSVGEGTMRSIIEEEEELDALLSWPALKELVFPESTTYTLNDKNFDQFASKVITLKASIEKEIQEFLAKPPPPPPPPVIPDPPKVEPIAEVPPSAPPAAAVTSEKAPEAIVPATPVVQPKAPESLVPATPVVQAKAPESLVPATPVVQAKAPESLVPATPVVQPKAPASLVPAAPVVQPKTSDVIPAAPTNSVPAKTGRRKAKPRGKDKNSDAQKDVKKETKKDILEPKTKVAEGKVFNPAKESNSVEKLIPAAENIVQAAASIAASTTAHSAPAKARRRKAKPVEKGENADLQKGEKKDPQKAIQESAKQTAEIKPVKVKAPDSEKEGDPVKKLISAAENTAALTKVEIAKPLAAKKPEAPKLRRKKVKKSDRSFKSADLVADQAKVQPAPALQAPKPPEPEKHSAEITAKDWLAMLNQKYEALVDKMGYYGDPEQNNSRELSGAKPGKNFRKLLGAKPEKNLRKLLDDLKLEAQQNSHDSKILIRLYKRLRAVEAYLELKNTQKNLYIAARNTFSNGVALIAASNSAFETEKEQFNAIFNALGVEENPKEEEWEDLKNNAEAWLKKAESFRNILKNYVDNPVEIATEDLRKRELLIAQLNNPPKTLWEKIKTWFSNIRYGISPSALHYQRPSFRNTEGVTPINGQMLNMSQGLVETLEPLKIKIERNLKIGNRKSKSTPSPISDSSKNDPSVGHTMDALERLVIPSMPTQVVQKLPSTSSNNFSQYAKDLAVFEALYAQYERWNARLLKFGDTAKPDIERLKTFASLRSLKSLYAQLGSTTITMQDKIKILPEAKAHCEKVIAFLKNACNKCAGNQKQQGAAIQLWQKTASQALGGAQTEDAVEVAKKYAASLERNAVRFGAKG